MAVKDYDVIVAGTGSMGSAACYYLAQKGLKVLGIEQFGMAPHENGSHAGQSRIIRKAYFEHPDYVPLLSRSYENLHRLEEVTGEKIYYQTGLLYYGPAGHPVIKGVKDAANKYQVPLHAVNTPPAFSGLTDAETLFEPDAGFLMPEKTIALYLQEAKKSGAELNTGEKILEWKKENDRITVRTNRNIYSSKKLVITAGAWTSILARQIQLPLRVTRQVLIWVQTEEPERYYPDIFPCWVIAADDVKGVWYGFPYLGGNKFPGPTGLKFALHHPADTTDPDRVNRAVTDEEVHSICEAAGKYFLPAKSKVLATKTCLYTNTPDEHFIIDFLPGCDNDVVIACGFSGHGFKFVPVVGEMLADLVSKGTTDLPAGFLGLSRCNKI